MKEQTFSVGKGNVLGRVGPSWNQSPELRLCWIRNDGSAQVLIIEGWPDIEALCQAIGAAIQTVKGKP